MNIVWFRRDLRVEDNPALFYATEAHQPVTAVYIATPLTWQSHSMGTPQVEWLHVHLKTLENQLNQLGIQLIYKRCDTFDDCKALLLSICQTLSTTTVYFNKEYEWDERQRDEALCEMLASHGIQSKLFDDQCLIPPDTIKNHQELPYRVFTPFKKASLLYLQNHPELLHPLPKPKKQQALKSTTITSDAYLYTQLSLKTPVKPGHKMGLMQLENFMQHTLPHYAGHRDIPSINGTSMLSPYLALGILSVRQCTALLLDQFNDKLDNILFDEHASTWLSELLWRDFYRMICFNFPEVSRGIPFKKETLQLEWDNNEENFTAWKEGRTGIPIVDSAMRQLNTIGWMHNRLRMIVAMFLTKNLWQDWRKGEAYFASKLIDWDFSSNNGGWQWCASTGNDAAPYFRVFNPISQSEKFDPKGQFIRRFCPELTALSDKAIHDPFEKASKAVNYPKKIVHLSTSRKMAIERFKILKQ
ncbi:MAG: deoxyribodipyrimidine photo-lyase [Legionellaceae bacterium]|nr:deoxyribodipyrimidine photo-lyase [Legionellaceae bacterium]